MADRRRPRRPFPPWVQTPSPKSLRQLLYAVSSRDTGPTQGGRGLDQQTDAPLLVHGRPAGADGMRKPSFYPSA